MQNPDNLWQLVAKHLSKEATEDDNKKLERILEEDPCLKFSLDVLMNFWQNADDENEEAIKKSFNRHIQHLQKKDVGCGK